MWTKYEKKKNGSVILWRTFSHHVMGPLVCYSSKKEESSVILTGVVFSMMKKIFKLRLVVLISLYSDHVETYSIITSIFITFKRNLYKDLYSLSTRGP